MSPRKAGCYLAAFLIAFVSLARAQGTYTQIDFPGATTTWAFGINSAGDIVGLYYDTNNSQHGFLLSGGIYTSIDYPGSPSYLTSINDMGQAVGFSFSGAGFLYDIRSQTFTSIQFPVSYVVPLAINNAGTIAGYVETNGSRELGFEYAIGSPYKRIATPGSENTVVTGIDASGKLVGYTQTSGTLVDFAFSYNLGKYQKIKLPTGATFLVFGINNAGNTLVGYYLPHGVEAGFIFQNKIMQPLRFPGAVYTYAYGVNDFGQVAGTFYETQTGNYHGFTWTPPANAARK